jgi:hypothetical protein
VQYSYPMESALFLVLDICRPGTVHLHLLLDIGQAQYSYTVGSAIFLVTDIDQVQLSYIVGSALFPILEICRPVTVLLHSRPYSRQCTLSYTGNRPGTVLQHRTVLYIHLHSWESTLLCLDIDQVRYSYTVGSALFSVLDICRPGTVFLHSWERTLLCPGAIRRPGTVKSSLSWV